MLYEQKDGQLICRFDEELSTLACSQIAGELSRRIAEVSQDANIKVVFDLADTSYIASAFLRLCVNHAKALKERFCIVNADQNIKDVFDIAGLTEVLSVL